jgi:hypothetical protein
MTKTSLFSFFSVAVLSLSLTIPASAAVVAVAPGVFTSPEASAGGVTTNDFNNGLVPSNFAFTGNSGVVSGNKAFVYSQPAGDSTDFAYVGPGGSITETLGTTGVGVNYFGLYWGSPDQYNSLTFTDTQGHTVTYGEGGIQIPNFTPNVQGNTDSYVSFWSTGNNWVSVSWASTTAAFEFDNVSAGVVTPEPASIALIAGGLLAIGVGALRRRK